MARSGTLRHRLTLQRRDTAPRDAHGGIPTVWSELGKRSAGVEDRSGNERFVGSGEIAEATTRITLRRDALTRTLTAADRLLDERNSPATVYEIVAPPILMNRDRDLQVLCKRS